MGIPIILTRISLAVKCDACTFKVARMEIRIKIWIQRPKEVPDWCEGLFLHLDKPLISL